MSQPNILIVRSVIQDNPQWIRENLALDNPMQVTYSPIQEGSFGIIRATFENEEGVVPDIYSIDDTNGVVTFKDDPGTGTATVNYYCTLLTDVDIQRALDLEGVETDDNDIRLAAADCLDMMASNQALIQKKITMDDLKVDGPSLAKALREHAKTLRNQVYDKDMQESTFEIVEEIYDRPGLREKIIKDLYRNS